LSNRSFELCKALYVIFWFSNMRF